MATNDKSTADYRKYPKGPNFFGIVMGACLALLLILGAALLFLTDFGKHLLRHTNPPHSYVQAPARPGIQDSGGSRVS